MNREMKRKLLTRKFSSIEYMEEMVAFHKKAIEGLQAAVQWFYDNPPQDVDWQGWHVSDRPDGWEDRALPNFQMNQSAFSEGVEKAKQGDLTYIEDATGSLQSFSKDMDVLGDKWLEYVPPEIIQQYGGNMYKTRKRASNIWWTVGEYWDNDEEILDEEITGPVDEEDLLSYLKPGESPD